jgi:hypothetical protein
MHMIPCRCVDRWPTGRRAPPAARAPRQDGAAAVHRGPLGHHARMGPPPRSAGRSGTTPGWGRRRAPPAARAPCQDGAATALRRPLGHHARLGPPPPPPSLRSADKSLAAFWRPDALPVGPPPDLLAFRLHRPDGGLRSESAAAWRVQQQEHRRPPPAARWVEEQEHRALADQGHHRPV